MSDQEKGTSRPDEAVGRPGKSDTAEQADTAAEDTAAGEAGKDADEPDADAPPQSTWAAALELLEHSPDLLLSQKNGAFGGSLVGGAQTGVSGGRVDGDVVLGGKHVVHQYVTSFRPAAEDASGEVTAPELDDLEEVFRESAPFATAFRELRDTRVTVLRGSSGTGRKSAALMLLRRAGAPEVRSMNRDIGLSGVRRHIGAGCGYVLSGVAPSRTRPLRAQLLLELREELRKKGSHLVITVDESAALWGVTPVDWQPPDAAVVLRAHLGRLLEAVDDTELDRLARLEPVLDFLSHGRPLKEIVEFARKVAAHHRGELDLNGLAGFHAATLEQQVSSWLDDSGLLLYDKAFLISLAVFDKAPYAVTGELSDELYLLLYRRMRVDDEREIPVFANAIPHRSQFSRSHFLDLPESTPWGTVTQRCLEFDIPETAPQMLNELWLRRPSVRRPLVRWLQELADDGRPLVRTRAASATATLAVADLPSAMALLIEPWANARSFQRRLAAANSLTLAHLAGSRAVPHILHAWCEEAEGYPHRRWTAIRAYALLADFLPHEALSDVEAIARGEHSDAERGQLAETAELLLLSGSTDVWEALVRWIDDKPELRSLALDAFLGAAARPFEGTEVPGADAVQPRLLSRATGADRPLVALWRAALSDAEHSDRALETLGEWVLGAEHAPEAEDTLRQILQDLAGSETETRRLVHLLRTLGGTQPAVAGRLLDSLTAGNSR